MGPIYVRTSIDLDPIQVLYFIYLFFDGQVLYSHFVTPFTLVLGL